MVINKQLLKEHLFNQGPLLIATSLQDLQLHDQVDLSITLKNCIQLKQEMYQHFIHDIQGSHKEFDALWSGSLLCNIKRFQQWIKSYCHKHWQSDDPMFTKNCSVLHELGLVRLLQHEAIHLVSEKVTDFMQDKCKGNFSDSLLDDCLEQVLEMTINFLVKIMQDEYFVQKLLWESVVESLVYRSMYDLRRSELFDIITEFPESIPCLKDFAICMNKVGDESKVASNLQQSIAQRLLHQGASTGTILTLYIATIKSMEILDPNNGCIKFVADPIYQYLRTRQDTTRCVISALIDEDSELFDMCHEEPGRSDDDIFQRLINIYDDKSVYIDDFQKILADSLLQSKDYEIQSQMHQVEVLKSKFGESSLQVCEVMLKDMADSRRMDNLFQSHNPTISFPIHPIIISRLFWPPCKADVFKFPELLARDLGLYENEYKLIKAARKLEWIPSVGNVELELEIGDQTLEFNVNPLQASLIYLFQEKDEYQVQELIDCLKTTNNAITGAASFWVTQGVLVETNNGYAVTQGQNKLGSMIEIDQQEEAMPAADVLLLTNFIKGWLTNKGASNITSIMMMVSTFLKQQAFTQEAVQKTLNQLVQEDVLDFSNGCYSLKN